MAEHEISLIAFVVIISITIGIAIIISLLKCVMCFLKSDGKLPDTDHPITSNTIIVGRQARNTSGSTVIMDTLPAYSEYRNNGQTCQTINYDAPPPTYFEVCGDQGSQPPE